MPKFSLALGWWAARWLAHIGVIKYLEENNLVPNEISGTSMWSIIAALYAAGNSAIEMEEICSKISYLKLLDFDLKKGIIKWENIKKFLKELFWNTKIENLKIPLKIVATNLKNWEKHVFTSWKIVDAIRSSISIPWIIMPNPHKWEELVDWWIVNNLPIEVLDWINIVAISVLRDVTRELEMKIKILGIEFNQNIFWLSYQILQKTIDIMMKQNESRSLLSPDKNIIYIHPKFVWIDYLEFNKFKEIIEIWYKESKHNGLAEKIKEKF